MAGLPLGAVPQDTAEFLLGRVAVTPVFFESNGVRDPSTEDWNATQIDQVLQKIRNSMQWWVDLLATKSSVHDLEFVFDEQYARNPVPTIYEPIARTSNDHGLWVGEFLSQVGLTTGGINDRVFAFNHAQRERLGTDWSFTIFVPNSTNDADGRFATGGTFSQAFAFPGGLYEVVPSGRPTSTFTHETGHIFWGFDEYPGGDSFQSRRGYYGAQNTNSVEGRGPGFSQQTSIMAGSVNQAFATVTTTNSTLAVLGWQDSDGDGIFDVLDVPLEFRGLIGHDATSNQLIVKGEARAVPLINRNTEGNRSDITLNRVSFLEVSLDDGPWQILAAPNQQVVEFDQSYSLPGIFTTLKVRFRDAGVGVTSSEIAISPGGTAGVGNGVFGVGFWDANKDGVWQSSEAGVGRSTIELLDNQGNPIPPAVLVDTAGLQNGIIGNTIPGVNLRFQSDSGSGLIGFDLNQVPQGTKSLWWFSAAEGGWTEIWRGEENRLIGEFTEAQRSVSIDVVGSANGSGGRLEAYDATGQLVARTSTGSLNLGERKTLSIHLDTHQIASIRAFGVGHLGVRLDRLVTGPTVSRQTNQAGVFTVAGLADGDYQIRLVAPHESYAPRDRIIPVSVVQRQGVVVVPMERNLSPWQNPILPENVDNLRGVEPADALILINNLNRLGTRQLGIVDLAPPYLDVNGDALISPLDALRVINYLNRNGVQQTSPPPNVVVFGGGIVPRTASAEPDSLLPMVDNSFPIPEKHPQMLTWDKWEDLPRGDFFEGSVDEELSEKSELQESAALIDEVLAGLFA